ncbi:NAD(P)-binding protein [Bradyrhizobium japonicum]
MRQDPIIIAGGGIGGLAAAIALARKGFQVTVLRARVALPGDRRGHPTRPQRVSRLRSPRARRCGTLDRRLHRPAPPDGRNLGGGNHQYRSHRLFPPALRQSLRRGSPRRSARHLRPGL